MSPPQRLTADSYRRMPWRNGLGVTTEIARGDGPAGELDWRVSVAEVATDGPFSPFPGCARVIVPIAGAGMLLHHPQLGRAVTVGPLEPYSFDGDWQTTCELLAGPVRDFNLITRRGRCAGSLSVLQLAAGEAVGLPAATTLLYALSGCCEVETDAGNQRLAAGETLVGATEGGNRPWRLAAGGEPVTAIAASILTDR